MTDALHLTDQLLPCPFCGGEAEFRDTSSTWVRCEDCGAEIQCQIEKKDAARLWNRRASVFDKPNASQA
jgi:Lar family restriction alleviation protein